MIDHGSGLVGLVEIAISVFENVNRQAVALMDDPQRFAEGFRIDRPSDRRQRNAGRLLTEVEAQHRSRLRFYVDRAVVIESEPVDRTANARHVARLDVRLDRQAA